MFSPAITSQQRNLLPTCQEEPTIRSVSDSAADDNDVGGGFINHEDNHDDNTQLQSTSTSHVSSMMPWLERIQNVNRVKMWPPWPLNLFTHDDGDGHSTKTPKSKSSSSSSSTSTSSSSSEPITATNTYPSAAAIIAVYLRQRARIGIRQLQEVGSQLWFHLPPAAPPLLLLASIPYRVVREHKQAGITLTKRWVPLFKDAFARNLAWGGLGLAVTSWAHMEVHRKKQLTPLPLALPSYRSVSRVFLPPFLPEEVPEPEIQALQHSVQIQTVPDDEIVMDDKRDSTKSTTTTTATAPSSKESTSSSSLPAGRESSSSSSSSSTSSLSQVSSLVNPRYLKQHLSQLYENAPRPQTFNAVWTEWKRVRAARRREAAKVRRLAVFDELVALQALKRQAARQRQRRQEQDRLIKKRQSPGHHDSSTTTNPAIEDSSPPLGYALVTGASQGIGRAIAVELARWEIPLILVARDVDRLISLAYDLEACYGIHCCVLKADLSDIHAAEKIYQTTHDAGLPVDLLVNNAGFAHDGLAVDMDVTTVERMVMVNAMTSAKLSKLYGHDMKQRRRGRILMVSSMTGLTSASPNSAMYGATKAFGKSLALSMAKELEPYGVGVTCLLPGPVIGTQFRQRSGTKQALCWYLPFYPRPAHLVAHLGVMSLLDGDTQVIPGWQNRVFVQLIRPLLPQRMEIMAVQAAWTPVTLPKWFRRKRPSDEDRITDDDEKQVQQTDDDTTSTYRPIDLKPRYNLQLPPRLLELPEPPEPPAPRQLSESSNDSFDDDHNDNDSDNDNPMSVTSKNATENPFQDDSSHVSESEEQLDHRRRDESDVPPNVIKPKVETPNATKDSASTNEGTTEMPEEATYSKVGRKEEVDHSDEKVRDVCNVTKAEEKPKLSPKEESSPPLLRSNISREPMRGSSDNENESSKSSSHGGFKDPFRSNRKWNLDDWNNEDPMAWN